MTTAMGKPNPAMGRDCLSLSWLLVFLPCRCRQQQYQAKTIGC